MLFTLGILVAEIVLSIKMQKKKNSVLRLVLGAIPSIVATFVWPLIPLEALWWMAIKYFVIFALTFIMIIAAVDENVWTYIFIGVMAYCMQHISNQLFAIIDIFTGIVVHRWAGMSLLVVISVIVYFVTYLFFVRVWHSGERIEISSRKLLVLSVIALSVTVVVSLYGAAYSLRLQDKSLFIITCVFSVISCVLCMALGRLLVKSKKSEIEVSVLKRLLYESRHQFEESKSSIEIINIKCHDLKHHINALGQKVDKEELACISDAINIYDNSFRTGNDALDIILMEKALLCSARHIRFTCMIDGALLADIKPGDIYSFFGNAIDNAMRSVSRLVEARRVISLRQIKRSDFYIIVMENYYDGKIVFEDGLPVTTQGDKDFHGFGMKSMKMIAEKYGRELNISAVGDIFRLEVLMPYRSDHHDSVACG